MDFSTKNNDRIVLFINPPNTNTVLDEQSVSFTNPSEHSDWGNYPAAGILTLASSVEKIDQIKSIYLDGVVCPFQDILSFIELNHHKIFAICMSTLSASYGAGLYIFRHSRKISNRIVHIIGNDHFTFQPELIIRKRSHEIDFGFVGNEVILGLTNLIAKLIKKDNAYKKIPGLVYKNGSSVVTIPQSDEAIYKDIDYSLVDRVYNHSGKYDLAFKKVFTPKIKELFGQEINRGVPIEIARGCIKFKNNDACSFCSIQYGGKWKNELKKGKEAWNIIEKAYQANYDYFYITADELPLTFRKLLLDMEASAPKWLKAIPPNERPLLTGYARADGICVEKNARLLYDLGFRIMMIGVDAGPRISLQAFNKQIIGSQLGRLDKIYKANVEALNVAHKVGLKIRIGFVVGHFGMTKNILKENIDYFTDLISTYPDAISTADIEILSPEPGSQEYICLTNPQVATSKSALLNLAISDLSERNKIADKWKHEDEVVTEELVNDYVKAFMPELNIQDLISARDEMRMVCKAKNVLIGEG